ncbi:MAG: DNA lyase [Thermotoga sp.]|nr:MAG: DNA lyase [Thermotoga sp.]
MLPREIKELYEMRKSDIERRLKEFKELFENSNDDRIFAELIFCLLTPQSKAKICWKAVENLMEKDLLIHGSYEQVLRELKGVRFKKNKAKYIIEARKTFTRENEIRIKSVISSFSDSKKAREWLVKNVKGMGYKEASHFLRNIGFGEDLAILDRHILKNLRLLRVIEDIPKKTLTKKRYMEIENKMREFSRDIGIPLSHLDLLFWSKETGEIFK